LPLPCSPGYQLEKSPFNWLYGKDTFSQEQFLRALT